MGESKRGFASLTYNSPFPLKTNRISGVFKRGGSLSFQNIPLPLNKGKGDKGGWGH